MTRVATARIARPPSQLPLTWCTTGTALMNSPTMVSTPGNCSGRPETMVPKTTSRRSVSLPSTTAQREKHCGIERETVKARPLSQPCRIGRRQQQFRLLRHAVTGGHCAVGHHERSGHAAQILVPLGDRGRSVLLRRARRCSRGRDAGVVTRRPIPRPDTRRASR